MLWRRLVYKTGGVITNNLDISSLAKVTDGYTPGHMQTAVSQVLTDRRIQQLSKRPLQAVEFIAPLARIDPIYKEEEESFKVNQIHATEIVIVFQCIFPVCIKNLTFGKLVCVIFEQHDGGQPANLCQV